MFEAVELKEDVYWVGAIDWGLRDFHGYTTPRGSTYNAYLVVGDKIALVDTVKREFAPEMLSRIKSVINPRDIDYLVVNHLEEDHSGCLPLMHESAPSAEILMTGHGEKALPRIFHQEWSVRTVKTGDELDLGGKRLQFLEAYMLHWPDSMMSYIPEDKILLPNDGFGQHYATAHRFDDERGDLAIVMDEAAKYFANILMPLAPVLGQFLGKVLKSDLEIETIAPSHGIIWRSHINEIVMAYRKWSSGTGAEGVLVIYDSFWGSTKRMAEAIYEGAASGGGKAKIFNARNTHYSDIVREILSASVLAIGSPTINEGMFPSMAQLLSYVKGLRPLNKKALVFGSYGWGGEAIEEMKKYLISAGIDVLPDDVSIMYSPTESDLETCTELGRGLSRLSAGSHA